VRSVRTSKLGIIGLAYQGSHGVNSQGVRLRCLVSHELISVVGVNDIPRVAAIAYGLHASMN
jgi:hypothetical protein